MAYANPDVKAAVIKDVLSGMSQRAASKKWGVTEMTIRNWRKKRGIEIAYHITSLTNGFSTQHITLEIAK